MIATLDGMGSTGTVRFWHRDEGFGVIDSPDTPGGCWAHFSHLWNDALPQAGPDEIIEVSGGFRELFEGETVDFEWAQPGQDGYPFLAVTVRPHHRPLPQHVIRRYKVDEHPQPDAIRGYFGPGQEDHI
jgi:CspA family cold shock protein